MIISTTRFGELEINSELIFSFIKPVLGYEHLSKYVLVDHTPGSPFKWLQSVEDKDIAFPVTVPGYFGMDYQFTIPQEDANNLEITNANDVLTLNIVNIPAGEPQNATINLIGPLVVNMENKKAMQLVLASSNYAVKHKLFADTAKNESTKPEMTAARD